MKQRLVILIGLLSVIFLVGVQISHACSCAGGANPCSFYKAEKGVAFIGTVTNVVEANEKYGQPIKGKIRKITIKVDEIFKGNIPNEVITSDDGFQCDNYPFMLGLSYLIYSKGILENTENILPVGLCSGTTPIENAQDSIKFLQQLKKGKMPAILYGKVQRVINDEKNQYQPLTNTKVVLTKIYSIENGQYKEPKKKDRKIEAVTNKNGDYIFENLGVGKYKISAVLPNDLWMQEYREFETGGNPSCDKHSLSAFTNGSISGRVVNADGTPARLALRISSIDRNTRFFYGETRSDDNGDFTFSGLNEGQYKINVYLPWYRIDESKPSPFEGFPFSRWYFPKTFGDKEAEIISLSYAQKIHNINLEMPPFPIKRTVTGKVVWEDGEPVEKGVIYYRMKHPDGEFPRYAFAEEDGTFSFQIYDQFEYELSASNNSLENKGYADWSLLNKTDLNNQIRLVLKPDE